MPVFPLDYSRLFDLMPQACVVLDQNLIVVEVNAAYLAVTNRSRGELLDESILDAFPVDPSSPRPGNAATLRSSVQQVFATRQPDVLTRVRYPIPMRRDGRRVFDERYWDVHNVPVPAADGTVLCVMCAVDDVTARLLADEVPPAVHH